jgi:hypothetical protein
MLSQGGRSEWDHCSCSFVNKIYRIAARWYDEISLSAVFLILPLRARRPVCRLPASPVRAGAFRLPQVRGVPTQRDA